VLLVRELLLLEAPVTTLHAAAAGLLLALQAQLVPCRLPLRAD